MTIIKTLTNVATALVGAVLATLCVCFAVGSYTSHSNDAAFERIQVGERAAVLVARFGAEPSERDAHGTACGYFTCSPCREACYERLWYENRFSIFDEKWFVELNRDQRVIRKGKIASP